jgi:hypothetical protein
MSPSLELAAEGAPMRQDVMNALRILAEKGLAVLQKAFNEGAVLPSIAILTALGFGHLIPQGATDEAPAGLLR